MVGWTKLLILYSLSAAPAASAKQQSSPSFFPRSHHSCRSSVSIRDGRRSRLGSPPSGSVGFISSPHNTGGQNKCQLAGSNNFHRLMTGNVVDVDTSSSPDANSIVGNREDDDQQEHVDRRLRFSGVARLYANKDPAATPDIVLDRLTSATVAIVGIGGVGSWTAESLCRSGIGNLILVDLDDICISNTNRQLHATSSAVGKMKIDIMKSRLLDINPKCNVTLVHDFVTIDNASTLLQSLLSPQLTACIDAIDGMYEKTALILACVEHGIPIVTCGGAAGRMDPTQIVVDDLTKVAEDRLLFKSRKLLRQKHGFPKVAMPGSEKGKSKKKTRVRKWRIPAVYSTEVQQKPLGSSLDENASSFRTCDGALGTSCFVTGTYGFVAAQTVVEMIALNKLIVPKKIGRSK